MVTIKTIGALAAAAHNDLSSFSWSSIIIGIPQFLVLSNVRSLYMSDSINFITILTFPSVSPGRSFGNSISIIPSSSVELKSSPMGNRLNVLFT